MTNNITFSTAWYILSAKFPPTTYQTWITNMISCVNNYNLVIYTDDAGLRHLQSFGVKHADPQSGSERFLDSLSRISSGNPTTNASNYLENPNIMVKIKKMEDFYNYRYRDNWINNHTKNIYLNQRTEWKLHMLWAEKVHFVKETMDNKYFDTEYYGWCDIGYFRDGAIPEFPSARKIEVLNKDKIYYACVNNNDREVHQIMRNIMQQHNSNGLPSIPIDPNQISVAGGFFVTFKENIDWWKNTFNDKLLLYFRNQYLVKDDQMIIINCITENPSKFQLIKENSPNNWFLFQRYLC